MAALIFIKIRTYEWTLETKMKVKLSPNLSNMISFLQRNYWEIHLGESLESHVSWLLFPFTVLIWLSISSPSFGSDINRMWWWNLMQISCEILQENPILSQGNVKCPDKFHYTTTVQAFIESPPVKSGNCTI